MKSIFEQDFGTQTITESDDWKHLKADLNVLKSSFVNAIAELDRLLVLASNPKYKLPDAYAKAKLNKMGKDAIEMWEKETMPIARKLREMGKELKKGA
jgi:hypothetical protein